MLVDTPIQIDCDIRISLSQHKADAVNLSVGVAKLGIVGLVKARPIDIHVDVPRVPFQKLADLAGGESSATIRGRVEPARQVQEARFAGLSKPNLLVNGDMGPAEVQQFCQLDETAPNGLPNLMRAAMQQMDLSARAYHRVLKLSRTIADLAEEAEIGVTQPGRSPAIPAAWGGLINRGVVTAFPQADSAATANGSTLT